MKQAGTKKQSTLCNLSAYATAYLTEENEIRGLMLSAYRANEDGERIYTNIWLKPDHFSIKKRSDGAYNLTVKLKEIEKKKEKKEDPTEKDKYRKGGDNFDEDDDLLF